MTTLFYFLFVLYVVMTRSTRRHAMIVCGVCCLVGPCALDYTKMKTGEHYWSDPPADELVQRHRIHSSGNHHIRPDSPKRHGLQVRCCTGGSAQFEP